MKQRLTILLSLIVISLSLTAQIVKGDMNDDGQLTVADLSNTASRILENVPLEYIPTGSFDRNRIDNSQIVGTWYLMYENNRYEITFGADGLFINDGDDNYRLPVSNSRENYLKYEYQPDAGYILLSDNATGRPMYVIDVVRQTTDMLILSQHGSKGMLMTFSSTKPEIKVQSMNFYVFDGTDYYYNGPIYLTPNSYATLIYSVYPTDVDNSTCTFSSSNPGVAKIVDDNILIAVSEGTATVTCTTNDGSNITSSLEIVVRGKTDYPSLYFTSERNGWTFSPMSKNGDVFDGFYFIGDSGFKLSAEPYWGQNVFAAGESSGVLSSTDGNCIMAPGSGFYHITANLYTMRYTLEKIFAVSIIGEANGGGWATDSDMTFDGDSWVFNGYLSKGMFKFRANYDWAINWGGPIDALTLNGENLSIPADGIYTIRLWPNCDGHGRCTIEPTGNAVVINGETYYINGKGNGTEEDPFDVTAILSYIKQLPADVVSPCEVYFSGNVTSFRNGEEPGNSYGNATFYISDEGTSEQFYCYRIYNFNGEKFTSSDDLKIGDKVVIRGYVVNYKGNYPETVSGKSYIVSVNGRTSKPDVTTPQSQQVTINGVTVTVTNTSVNEVGSELMINLDGVLANGEVVETLHYGETTITFGAGTSSNAPKYYDATGGIRVYPNNTITITGDKAIASVEFECDGYNGVQYVGSPDPVVSFSGNSFYYENKYEGSTGTQLRIKRITIRYAGFSTTTR